MNINAEKTVWINVESDRYFIIPNETELAEGPFELKTVDRQERLVQEVDISNYEVTPEAAQEWLQEELNKRMDLAKQAVKSSFDERKKETEKEAAQILEEELPANLVSDPGGNTPPITTVTSENGTYNSFDSIASLADIPSGTDSVPHGQTSTPPASIVSSLDSSFSSLNSMRSSAINGISDVDGVMKEAVSILNRAVSDIQLTAARAAADLQDLKEKVAATAEAA